MVRSYAKYSCGRIECREVKRLARVTDCLRLMRQPLPAHDILHILLGHVGHVG